MTKSVVAPVSSVPVSKSVPVSAPVSSVPVSKSIPVSAPVSALVSAPFSAHFSAPVSKSVTTVSAASASKLPAQAPISKNVPAQNSKVTHQVVEREVELSPIKREYVLERIVSPKPPAENQSPQKTKSPRMRKVFFFFFLKKRLMGKNKVTDESPSGYCDCSAPYREASRSS